MALRYTMNLDAAIRTSGLHALCELVARCSGRDCHASKPITGADVFRHESGIHVAALLRDPAAYQPFSTQEVGRETAAFVIGKHSGSSSIRTILESEGVSVPASLYPKLLSAVRHRSRARKSGISAPELVSIARELLSERRFEKAYANICT